MNMIEEKKLEGIGGWLILMALGIIISPLAIAAGVFPTYSEIISNGTWETLTTPGTQSYHPLWAPIFIGEISINCGLIIIWFFVAYQFFLKKKTFPKWWTGTMVFSLVFILIDALVIKVVLPNVPIFDPDTTKEFSRNFIMTLIWVTYLIRSKRVKVTFVN